MTDFKAEIQGLIGAQRPWSMGFHLTGGVSEASLAATFTAAAAALWTTLDGLQNICTADVTTTQTVVSTLGPTMRRTSKTTTSQIAVGAAAGASLPWKDSCIVELFSATDIRKTARGSFYLPPFAQSSLVADVYTPAITEALQDIFDVFFPAIHTSGVQSFSFNRRVTKGGVPPFSKTILSGYRISDKPTSRKQRTKAIIPTYTFGTAF